MKPLFQWRMRTLNGSFKWGTTWYNFFLFQNLREYLLKSSGWNGGLFKKFYSKTCYRLVCCTILTIFSYIFRFQNIWCGTFWNGHPVYPSIIMSARYTYDETNAILLHSYKSFECCSLFFCCFLFVENRWSSCQKSHPINFIQTDFNGNYDKYIYCLIQK